MSKYFKIGLVVLVVYFVIKFYAKGPSDNTYLLAGQPDSIGHMA
jgi:hypothetical protein